MRQFLASPSALLPGVLALSLALLIAGYLVLSPRPFRIPLARRRPQTTQETGLAAVSNAAAALINKVLQRRTDTNFHGAVLERAGVKMELQYFALLIIETAVVAGLVGWIRFGPLVAVAVAVAVPLIARGILGMMAARRQRAFADQLDDTLQLLASSLRAGHSLLQALASVARDADEPTSVEFAQIINEARVGRELGQALEETATRMESVDFGWVTQAIAINREVGGNLAEVLDGVGRTIRERNQIRRQVQSLSAEGKLSAYVLIAMPFAITGFLAVANPTYIAKFTDSLAGYAMIAASVVLLVIGSIWLRKVTQVKF